MDNEKPNLSEEASTSKNAVATIATDIPADDSKSVSEKLTLKERCNHIPYILNGELYEIQTQDGENVTVKCCNCPPDRVYRGSVRSTGNFHMHIKRRHPCLLGKLHDMKVAALLERRDRLMKNRKPTAIPYSCRRKSAPHAKRVKGISVKRESLSDHTEGELDVAHTHKLKIRTAFQRHQMQQQEAMMRKGDDATFVGSANTILLDENRLKPIDYSLKEINNKHNNGNQLLQCEAAPKESEGILSKESVYNAQLTEQLPMTDWSELMRFANISGAHSSSVIESSGTTAISPCLSSISSYASHQSVDDSAHNHQGPIMDIKNENPVHDQPLDLSTPPKVNSNNSNLSSSGFPSRKPWYGDAMADNVIPAITKLFQEVDRSVRGLQSELGTRNQIETNRLYLELAKFKYLYPSFHFNC